MQTIYQPQGKAREYSPLAANIYSGCDHGCKYCYVPNIINRFNSSYRHNEVKKKDGYIEQLRKNCTRLKNKDQVLLSFTGDPYCKKNDEFKMTRKALLVLLESMIPVRILTKGGTRCLQDVDVFKMFDGNIAIGATLTFDNDKDSIDWEPGAQLPGERVKALKILHENGIRTWASFEPVLSPRQSLNLMSATIEYVDEYKIGKLNNYHGLDKKIDWNAFLSSAIDIMESYGKKYYIKVDLANAADKVAILNANTRNMDYLNLKWDGCEQQRLLA